jgi:hypothetical protein
VALGSTQPSHEREDNVSAWIVSKLHIDYMVTAAIEAGEAMVETPENEMFLAVMRGMARSASVARLGANTLPSAVTPDGIFADWCEERGFLKHAKRLRESANVLRADETGRMLWRENLKSVAYRYPDDGDGDRPGPDAFRDSDVDSYTWAKTKLLNGAALYKTLACYTYQSCEHPDWADSEAQALTARLMPERAKLESWRHAALDNDTIPWGW